MARGCEECNRRSARWVAIPEWKWNYPTTEGPKYYKEIKRLCLRHIPKGAIYSRSKEVLELKLIAEKLYD